MLFTSVIARNTNVDPNDTVKVKTHLNNLGYMEIPEYGIDDMPDELMFKGIEKFQKDKKLKVDGIIKPRGETEAAMNNENQKMISPDPISRSKASVDGKLRTYANSDYNKRGSNKSPVLSVTRRSTNTIDQLEKAPANDTSKPMMQNQGHEWMNCDTWKGDLQRAQAELLRITNDISGYADIILQDIENAEDNVKEEKLNAILGSIASDLADSKTEPISEFGKSVKKAIGRVTSVIDVAAWLELYFIATKGVDTVLDQKLDFLDSVWERIDELENNIKSHCS